MEKLQTYPLICEGGLNSDKNYLLLSQRTPGMATALVNYEPSLYGGYRRISGFEPLETGFPEVDPTLAEGAILHVSIFNEGILSARKLKSGATYNFYYWTEGDDWTGFTTGLTLTSTGVTKIRSATFNFDGTEKVVFTDGVNGLIIFDSTNWVECTSTSTGADFAHAGGDQIIDAPKYVTIWKNTVFISGDATNPHIVAYSAPTAEFDWTAANGAGQLVMGFAVKQIKPFRDELYVFGETKIKKVVVSGTDFLIQDVTSNVGCLAPDSVVEIDGDLQFISQDGVRTVAGTDKIGDVELAVLSKNIQQDMIELISSANLEQVNSVVVRKKSQVRHFFSDENLDAPKNVGVIGALKASQNGIVWEWGRLKGIRTSVVTSGYIGAEEYVLHGDFNGKIYRQEQGSDFDGVEILAVYATPYLDFGEIYVRKTIHKVTMFIRAEGQVVVTAALQFDWDATDVTNPTATLLESDTTGAKYGVAVYGTSHYATAVSPILIQNLEGSGMACKFTFTTRGSTDPFSIQAIVLEYAVNGRK